MRDTVMGCCQCSIFDQLMNGEISDRNNMISKTAALQSVFSFNCIMRKSTCFKFCALFCLIVLAACEGIFVPDPLDPQLPKYTESGNNVAGAYINDEVWNSVVAVGFMHSSDKPQLVSTPTKDSLWICFTGTTGYKTAYIGFILSAIKISSLEDLQKLEGRKIELDGSENAGYCQYTAYPPPTGAGGTGQIYFKSVQWGKTGSFVILSGTFGFVYQSEDGAVSKVSSGRFDYRISDNDEFYVKKQ